MKRWLSTLLALLLCLTAASAASAEETHTHSLELTAERIANRLSAAVTVQSSQSQEFEGILICSLYDANGKMLEVTQTPVVSDGKDMVFPVAFQSNAEQTAVIKAFLLNAESWTPCCVSAEQQAPKLENDETEILPLG